MTGTQAIWNKHFGESPAVGLDHPKIEQFFEELAEDCIAESSIKYKRRMLPHDFLDECIETGFKELEKLLPDSEKYTQYFTIKGREMIFTARPLINKKR